MNKSVYTDVEGLMFHKLESLNATIIRSLREFHDRKLTGRSQLFEDVGKDCLRTLPSVRYQMKERKSVIVMCNRYATPSKHHYSVPKESTGKRVDIVYDADTLEIFHGLRPVTTRHRDDTPYGYTRKEAHHLPGRHGSYEKNPDEVFEWAAQLYNILLLYLREVASPKKYLPLAFRSCRGIFALEKTFGLDRLVSACACALQMRVYGYQDVIGILNRGDDSDFLEQADKEVASGSSLVYHKHIRGREYFSKSTRNNGNK